MMPSPFRQLFQKTGKDSAADSAGNEDLECGHRSLVLQKRTTSGRSSPHGVYLPAKPRVLAPAVPGSRTSSGKYIPNVHYDCQHGSTAELPLTPSGPSRVIGYLPRATCHSPRLLVTPTGLVMPSQQSQNPSDADRMASIRPQLRSSSVPSMAFRRSLSPRPPFDRYKPGLALQVLEAHGSSKTVPSSQWDGGALNPLTISRLVTRRETSEEDRAAEYPDSDLGQLESQILIHTGETSYQQMVSNLSLPQNQSPPDTVYQPVVLSQDDLSTTAHVPNAPTIEGGKILRDTLPSSVYALPSSEAQSSSQVTWQELHWSQVPPKLNQTQSSNAFRLETVAVDPSPSLPSMNPSFEGILENDTSGRMTGIFGVGMENSEEYGHWPTVHEKKGKEKQRLVGNLALEHVRQVSAIIQERMVEGIDEFIWSPAPSDDGQEAPSVLHTSIPCHTRSDASLSSPTSRLASDSNPGVFYSPLPQIDVLIPAGNINLNSHTNFLSSSQQASMVEAGKSSSILLRYSGIITDGASSRPMSEIELEEEVKNSLEYRAEFPPSMPSSMQSMSQVDHNTSSEQMRGEHEPDAGSGMFPHDRVQRLSADAGPGRSQSSSSMSTDCYSGNPSGYKARSELHMLPALRARCHTPPLLFGPNRSNATSILALGSTIGRFNQNLEAVRSYETGHSPTNLYSLGEQDWETISAGTEAHIASNAKTGSSLTDNSDSGSLSESKEVHHPFRSIKTRPVMQHPAHPRHNYSFLLLKNSQTGEFVQVPQYEYTSGGFLPNNNASSQLVSSIPAVNLYQYSSPLQTEHTHPLASSPPIIRFRKSSALNDENDRLWVHHNHLNSDFSSSGPSEGVQRVKEEQTQDLIYEMTEDVLNIPRPALNRDQPIMDFREQSCQSSAWFSTVSDVMSSELSLPRNNGVLTKIRVQDSSEHVDDTLEQRLNQDIKSSLAGSSSLGASFSSSRVPLASSLIGCPDTSLCSRQRLYQYAVQQDLELDSQPILADFHRSLARSSTRESSAVSTSNTENLFSLYPACGLQPDHYNSLPHRHRSSSESHSRLMSLPSAQKAPVTSDLSSDSGAQQITSPESLLRSSFPRSDDNDSRYSRDQQNIFRRRDCQSKMDDAFIDDPTAPSTIESRPFVHHKAVHTNAPTPILVHPVYGNESPRDHFKPGPLRPRSHPRPLGPHLFQRPIARADSPHLHCIPHPTTTDLLERHVLFSRIYLIPSMVVPPIALVYGHGYMDSLMRLHTGGEIKGFRATEKTIALCWGYGLSTICIFAIIIAIIMIPAPA